MALYCLGLHVLFSFAVRVVRDWFLFFLCVCVCVGDRWCRGFPSSQVYGSILFFLVDLWGSKSTLLFSFVLSNLTRCTCLTDVPLFVFFFVVVFLQLAVDQMIVATHFSLAVVAGLLVTAAVLGHAKDDKKCKSSVPTWDSDIGQDALAYLAEKDQKFEKLYAPSADINRAGSTGLTPLLFAARDGEDDILDFLVQRGADVNKANDEGMTPLGTAVAEGRTSTVLLLIKRGADVNKPGVGGTTPLLAAVFQRQTRIAELLVKHGADVNKADADGTTPAGLAAWGGCTFDLEALGSEADLNKADKNGDTPLHFCARRNDLVCIRVLLAAGANADSANAKGLKPADVATKPSVISFLKDPSAALPEDPATADECGAADAANAATCGGGASPASWDSDAGHHVLSFLARGDARFVSLRTGGIDVNAAGASGATPLIFAAANGRLDAAQFLVALGADVNRGGTADNGVTPLQTAAAEGHEDVVRFLVASGAAIDAPNQSGYTPLTFTAMGGREDIAAVLIEGGANVNAAGHDGVTPLLYAAMTNHHGVAALLLEKGADVNLASKSGVAPLLVAATKGHDDIVRLLISKGANLTTAEEDGNTPLVSAAFHGHVSTIKILFEAGVDLNTPHKDGTTALQRANSEGHQEVVDFLTANGAKAPPAPQATVAVEDEATIDSGTVQDE